MVFFFSSSSASSHLKSLQHLLRFGSGFLFFVCHHTHTHTHTHTLNGQEQQSSNKNKNKNNSVNKCWLNPSRDY